MILPTLAFPCSLKRCASSFLVPLLNPKLRMGCGKIFVKISIPAGRRADPIVADPQQTPPAMPCSRLSSPSAAAITLPRALLLSLNNPTPMAAEPLDVEEELHWDGLRPRENKRRSSFLEPSGKSEMLCLPVGRVDAGRNDSAKPSIPSTNTVDTPVATVNTPNVTATKPHTTASRHRISIDPSIIIAFIHVVINLILLLSIAYVLGCFLYFVTVDLLYKVARRREEVRGLAEEARRLYVVNRCDPTTRVPALETQCREWAHQMDAGLSGIKYTRIVVEMAAEALDAFMNGLSLKSGLMICGFMVLYLIFRRR